MSKYDFDVDLSENTSTGIILNRLKPASTVLEFGCAMGRMTKYMKERMACKVYIVEIDEEAYNVAINYAVDGICGDILDYEWKEKFGSLRFDAIIFADVLEHLSLPEKTLNEAAQLLDDEGEIFVSIPNITHNDILTKAINERFDYTETGLLDNTHVHFWGRHNIDTLTEQCGLKLGWITGTRCQSGTTEQYFGTEYSVDPLLLNCLKERTYGEIYQFVFSLVKTSETETSIDFNLPEIILSIYFDRGGDFKESEVIKASAVYNDEGRYVFNYVVNCTDNIKRIRIDPTEFQGCIINNVSVLQGNNELPPTYSEYVELNEGVLLLGDDPMMIVECTEGDAPVKIHAEILLPGTIFVRELERECQNKQKELNNNLLVIHETDKKNHLLSNKIMEIQIEKSDMQASIMELKKSNVALLNEIKSINSEISVLGNLYNACQLDLGAYVVLVDKKDRLLIEKDKEIERYRNMTVVKVRELVAKVFRKIKRIVKGFLS